MEYFKLFIDKLICSPIIFGYIPNHGLVCKENMYLSKFNVLNKAKIRKEYERFIDIIINNNDKEMFLHLIQTLIISGISEKINIDSFELTCLEPLFVHFKPKLSTLLTLSHCFCDCVFYKNCLIENWIVNNDIIYSTEIFLYYYFLNTYKDYIEIDVDKYDWEVVKLNNFLPENEKNENEKNDKSEILKQLYSIIYYFNKLE